MYTPGMDQYSVRIQHSGAMPLDPVELDDLGVLRIRGADAERFLQGQLSNDLARLEREGALTAGFHNPQGRTIALLRLLRVNAGDILAVLPRELAESVAARLGRYVLRAKVQVTDESAAWRVRGIVQEAAPGGIVMRVAGGRGPTEAGSAASVPAVQPSEATLARWISLMPAADARPTADAKPTAGRGTAPESDARRAWRLLDIAAGLPQVYARTSEQFVAQMLNLDLIDAISFSKGCYTGQEVIARAHYRGRVKRRMQRWRTTHAAELVPGDAARLCDGRAVRVIEAAALPDGRCELLAVAPIEVHGDAAAAEAREAESTAAAAEPVLDAEPLPLPYALPD